MEHSHDVIYTCIHIPPCCKTYKGLSSNFVFRFLYIFFQFKFHKWNNYINYVWLIYVPALCNSKQILWRCAMIMYIYISNLMINDKSLFMTFGMILSVYLCCYATNLCSVPFFKLVYNYEIIALLRKGSFYALTHLFSYVYILIIVVFSDCLFYILHRTN